MCKLGGKAVKILRLVGGMISTEPTHHLFRAQTQWTISRLFNQIIHHNPHYSPQQKGRFLPLFEQLFYPVSTAPIIKTAT